MRVSLVLALFTALSALPSIAAAQPLIVIDAGHGGSDPGAVGCSLEEANVVLDVSTRLRTELERAGIRVALTRDVDEFVGLSARASFANSMSADGFVSVHSNANAGTPATGTETFISNSAGARSLELATLLQAGMISAWGLRDRGVKRADFVVVRDTTMPAALAELAFTNNCAVDATRLASATDRQAMAEAQARAILEWLGVMPGMNGTLRGVIFEDQGVGTMDLSVRLPGATVRIVETGATATADSPDANWLFDLPAGTYTVEASAAGHTTERRMCDVTSGGTTWCSTGLFPTAMPTPDAAVAPMPDAFVVSMDDDAFVTVRPDAASPMETPDSGVVSRPNAGDCACRASTRRGNSGSAWMLLMTGLVLAGAMRRRRAFMVAIGTSAALAVILSSCTGAEATSTPLVTAEAERDPIATIASQRGRVIEGRPISIVSEREYLLSTPNDAPLASPMISPDGRTVLVSTSDFASLFAWREGALTSICTTAHCGHEPRFFGASASGESLVATRTPEQSASAIPGDAYTLDGHASTTRMGAHGALAFVENEDTVRVRIDGQTRTLRAHGDRFVRAELSPDRRFVMIWGLVTGVSLHRLADDVVFDLGVVGHPHFDPDGRALVFDRTTDEGHTLLTGDVFLAELPASTSDELTVRPVLTTERIETNASLSRIDTHGHASIALERDGAIVIAEIQLTSVE